MRTKEIKEQRNAASAFIKSGIKSGIAARIRETLQGHDVAGLAKKLGISRATIYDWSGGRFLPDVERLGLFAASTGISICWLITGLGSKERDGPPEGYALPAAGMGNGNVNPAPLAIEERWLKSIEIESRLDEGDTLAIMVAIDDAMEPTIKKNDILIYKMMGAWDRNPVRAPAGIYALRIADLDRSVPGRVPKTNYLVRRVEWDIAKPGTVVISCDKPLYHSDVRRLSAREAPRIVGPVVWRAGLI